MATFQGWAAPAAGRPLEPLTWDPGLLGPEEVEIAVEHCGICHSDLSTVNDEWGISSFPVVPGHEVVGRVLATGDQVKGIEIGDRVGVGWTSESCMHCHQCLEGRHHLCARAVATMGSRHGGFADRLRTHWAWAIPLPETLDPTAAGPLLCGGITVFAPLALYGIRPTDRVGIVGIGGLGHLGLMFANAWGCEVTAFTSNESKTDEARRLGAHHVVPTRDPAALRTIAGTLDFLLVTVSAPLDWFRMLKTLAPNGRMHILGSIVEPVPIPALYIINQQLQVSGSPTGSPATIASMLEFAARHQIAPHVEHFPMRAVNEAFAHLEAGRARYRVVLDADHSTAA